MKQLPIFLFIVLLLAGNISVAQNSVLAGKIVDENDKPVRGAVIKISKDGMVSSEAKSDEDGLYCSKLLPCDSYKVTVIQNGKDMGSKKLKLDGESGSKKFFLVTITEKRMTISEMKTDPAVAVKLAKIEKEQSDLDFPVSRTGTFILKKDTSTIHRSAEKSPQMK